jgi:catechol 2,3-dioxygenase-like lactoylglutathione lyase family enzyme
LVFHGTSQEGPFLSVIPELVVPDPVAAQQMLCSVFGFWEDSGLLVLGDQRVALAKGVTAGHGVIDHLALSVPDIDAVAAQMRARGAVLDPEVTPDGPKSIAEFWGAGVRYLFLQGPQGVRIELLQNLAQPKPLGHDHIGIPCTDIAASERFCQSLGARTLSSVSLNRPEGVTQVRFLALGTSVLELYQPPQLVAPSASGFWRRLLIDGASVTTGPDGLQIAPR